MNRPPNATTQCARILRLLLDAKGDWVPLPEILKLGIAQYNARISSLREHGHSIENRTETINGVRHSWYRLGEAATASVTPPDSQPAESAYMKRIREEEARTAPLFAAVRP